MASATLISQTKEKLPNVKIYVFYKEVQTVGKMGDEYVRRTQEMEGVEWIWNNGIIEAQTIEKMETEIKNAPRADLYETQVREFKNFLSMIKKSM